MSLGETITLRVESFETIGLLIGGLVGDLADVRYWAGRCRARPATPRGA
jgi:hypothetical protein